MMEWTEERKALLWLSLAKVPAHKVHALIGEAGSASRLRQDYDRLSRTRFSPGENQRLSLWYPAEKLEEHLSMLEKRGVHLLFQGDRDYPPLLASIGDAPYLLYYAGQVQALQKPAVAIVGTRRASPYGRKVAFDFAGELAKAGFAVVSGLAHGIDEAAHIGTLEKDGCTVGILGSGINVPYPKDHQGLMRRIATGKGLILSEYPYDEEPRGFHFPHRNRIISGLSLALIFAEGKIRSGGMRTVDAALSQGREVYAVPGPVGKLGSEGPNSLIRDGAKAITCVQDLLDDLLPILQNKTQPSEIKCPPVPEHP